MDADEVELRVLGCLIEKQRTTPDVYPLSLNALRLACNQSTNRDPVVDYDESMIRAALEHLTRKGWVRLTSGPGSRAAKYRQMLDQALQLAGPEMALLCVLVLRGPQTAGELKQRTERLHPFGSLDEIEQVLGELAERELAEQLPRRPGQKEQRYQQLLGGESSKPAHESPRSDESPHDDVPAGESDRIASLERDVQALREEVASLRSTLEAEVRRVDRPST